MTVSIRTLALAVACCASPGALGQEALIDVISNVGGGLFGSSVSGAGDVNADGFHDFLVGSPAEDGVGVDSGAVRVYSGEYVANFNGGTPVTSQVLMTLTGQAGGDHFGEAVGAVGDLDGDGSDDFLVGAPFQTMTASAEGVVHVISGATGAPLFLIAGGSAFDWLGFSVGGAGDVDNDGFVDMVFGAPAPTQVGGGVEYVRVHSGQTGLSIHTFFADPLDDAQFGFDVAGGSDIDADGFGDLLVGERFFGNDLRGRLHVFSGQSGGLIDRVEGASNEKLGTSVAWMPDANDDSVPEIVVGGPGFQSSAGRAQVLSGADRSQLREVIGTADEQLGYSVSGVGDQEFDLTGDFLVGAPGGAVLGSDTGEAALYSGGDGSEIFGVSGGSNSTSMGWAVSTLGDITGDGIDDFIIASPYDDSLAINGGSVQVVRGGCGGGAILSYGSSCPGSGGFAPELSFTGCAKAGGSVIVKISGGLGLSQAFWFISASPAEIPLDGGCFLNVGVPVLSVIGPVPLFGVGEGNGMIMINPTLPANAAPGTAYFTAACLDPGVPQGFTTTNGVEVNLTAGD